MTRTTARLLAGSVVWLVLGAGTGCALIGTDHEPRAVEELPEDLFSTTTTSTAPPANEPEFVLPLYFYNLDGGLVRIDRQVESPPDIQGALEELARGPNEEEAGQEVSIRTRFIQDMNPMTNVTDGVLEVTVEGTSLREATTGDNANRVREIYTQIVCTVHALDLDVNTDEIDGIDLVTIVDADGQILVNTPGGEVVDRAVGPADFNDCKTAAQLAEEAEAEEGENGENGQNGENGEGATDDGNGFPASPSTVRYPTTGTGPS